jgi:capsular polysaccharide biosynthesis protein
MIEESNAVKVAHRSGFTILKAQNDTTRAMIELIQQRQ